MNNPFSGIAHVFSVFHPLEHDIMASTFVHNDVIYDYMITQRKDIPFNYIVTILYGYTQGCYWKEIVAEARNSIADSILVGDENKIHDLVLRLVRGELVS